MTTELKKLDEDDVYRLGMNEAQHNDFNVAGVLMAVSFIIGVIIGMVI